MTDKTDIAALQRPTRKHYDWSKAIWMDCERCGEAHTGTVLAGDGARICAGCCDAEYYYAWEDLAERAIKRLEAERQRAENASAGWLKVIDERQTALDQAADYAKLAGTNAARAQAAEKEREGLQKALVIYGDEITELRAKLANPVVLPNVTSERADWTTLQWIEHLGGRFQHGNPGDYIEFGSVYAVQQMLKQFGRTMMAQTIPLCADAIRAAGFPVKGGE